MFATRCVYLRYEHTQALDYTGVAIRVLVVREVAGSGAGKRYAGFLSFGTTGVHSVEPVAERMDQ